MSWMSQLSSAWKNALLVDFSRAAGAQLAFDIDLLLF